MQAFSNTDVLEMWETGFPMQPLDQGLLLLRYALPASSEEPADWPLGRRNRTLFELHRAYFGSHLQCWSSCTACGENVELELDLDDLIVAGEEGATIEFRDVKFRLPTSRDLAQAVVTDDVNAAAKQLVDRCCVDGHQTLTWTNELLAEIGEKFSLADPMAETRLALNCPACGNKWEQVLDIAKFVWAEIDVRARQLLWEVHTLASAYGWTESDTLALSPVRRAMYMEMVHA